MIVLDTNVLSEVQKFAPDERVMAWLDAQEPGDLYITAVTAEEMLFGASILPVGGRRSRLIAAIEAMLISEFDGRILPYDTAAAMCYAAKVPAARERGITVGHADGKIGAIVATQQAASIAIRDPRPFEAMCVKVVNPWDYQMMGLSF